MPWWLYGCPEVYRALQEFPEIALRFCPKGFVQNILRWRFCPWGFYSEVFPQFLLSQEIFPGLVPQRFGLGGAGGFSPEVFPLCIFLEVLSMKVLSGRSYPKVFVPEVLPQRFSPGGTGGLAHEVLHQRFLRFFWVPQVLPWRFCPGGFVLEVLPQKFCNWGVAPEILQGK